MGGSVGSFVGRSNRSCEFLLESDREIDAVAEGIVRIFEEFALPYFEKFSSLDAIDAELNRSPQEATPNRVAPWLRCATGVIVAKLVGRPNYPELVAVYSEILSRSDKGFYLKRFQALLKTLETIGPEGRTT